MCPCSRWADRQDTSGRISNLLTVFLAFIGSVSLSASGSMGALVNVVNAVNAVIMVACIALNLPQVQDRIKNYSGRLDFTETVTDTTGTAAEIIAGWDLARECKHRIWHPFWDCIMLSLKQKDASSGPEVARLQELKELTANNGLHRIKASPCCFRACAQCGRAAGSLRRDARCGCASLATLGASEFGGP